jgi:hypothetical protein
LGKALGTWGLEKRLLLRLRKEDMPEGVEGKGAANVAEGEGFGDALLIGTSFVSATHKII